MNRTRTSSLDAFGLRDQRNRIYPALEASDGSTLSLDFTAMGGTLDSRFTFSRTSTATLINSSGLVQYGNHNLFTNTAWLGSTLPTNWALLIGTGTTTWNGDGSVTMTAVTNQRPAINHATVTTINPGLPHTFGYLATNVSGSPQISQIITSSVAGETFAINGVTVASTTVVQSNDLVSCTFTPTTTNVTARLGPGSSSAMSNTSVTASRPQFNVGSSLRPYAANTSTSGSYQAPRFDHDPTTLAPRGLLIEGSATNLLNWSESFATSGGTNNNWADTNITRNSTDNTDPANGTTALRVTASAGNGTIISTSAMGTSAQRTFSIWLRRVSGTGNIQYTLDNGSTYTTQAITSSWVRYAFAATTAAQRVGIRIVTSGDAIELWGAQLEAGSGASSYIPTGSSTVQRALDACSMTGSNFSSWYGAPSAFTVLLEGITVSSGAYNRILNLSSGANTTGSFSNANIGIANASSNRPFLNVFVTANNDVDAYVPIAGAVTNGVSFKVAARCQAGLYRITRGVGLSASSTHNGFPAGLANLYFGGSSGSYQLSTHYSKLQFWPTALPDSQMDTLVT